MLQAKEWAAGRAPRPPTPIPDDDPALSDPRQQLRRELGVHALPQSPPPLPLTSSVDPSDWAKLKEEKELAKRRERRKEYTDFLAEQRDKPRFKRLPSPPPALPSNLDITSEAELYRQREFERKMQMRSDYLKYLV